MPNSPRETRAFPAMERSLLFPFRPGKKETPRFRSFPVLTTARVVALKWGDPRCQCASIEIIKTKKVRKRLIDNHDKHLRRDQREGKPDSNLADPDLRPSSRD